MKKKYVFLCFIFLILGCETNVDPNGVFRNQLVFYSILNEGDSIQKALVYKLVRPNEDGTAPLTDREIIKNASIRIWENNDKIVTFKFNDDKYGDSIVPSNSYYADNFKPKSEVVYTVEINTEKGLNATSKFKMPKDLSYFDEEVSFTIPRKTEATGLFWEAFYWMFNKYYWKDYYVLVRPWLKYTVKKNGITESKKYLIPDYYKEENGRKEPVRIQPKIEYCYKLKTNLLKKVLAVVSEAEPVDAKIRFDGVLFEGLSFCDELKIYYVTNKKYGANFSAIIDKYDYSNIKGGHGFFAGTGYVKTFVELDRGFVKMQKLKNVVTNFK